MRWEMVRLIALRELRQRMRGTGFKVTTAFGVVLIAGLFFLPAILNAVQNAGERHIAVVDPSGRLTPALQAGLPDRLPNGKPAIALRAEPNLHAAEHAGADGILIPGDLADPAAQAVYQAKRPGAEARQLRNALAQVAGGIRLQRAGVQPEQLRQAFNAPPLTEHATGAPRPSAAARGLVYVLLIMLYLTVLVYGAGMATSIIQEKASRVTEMMVAAVSSLEYMTGKVGGVGLAGLVQYACWLVAGIAGLIVKAVVGGHGIAMAAVSPGTLALFAVFFLLGYGFYGTLYAALSAPVSRLEDGTVLGQPLMVVIVVGFALSFVAINSPDDGFVTVGSLIPFFSPMVMFTRSALSSPPIWQLVLSMVLLVAAIALAIWTLAKVFRIGLLMYGKRPSARELVRLARTA